MRCRRPGTNTPGWAGVQARSLTASVAGGRVESNTTTSITSNRFHLLGWPAGGLATSALPSLVSTLKLI